MIIQLLMIRLVIVNGYSLILEPAMLIQPRRLFVCLFNHPADTRPAAPVGRQNAVIDQLLNPMILPWFIDENPKFLKPYLNSWILKP